MTDSRTVSPRDIQVRNDGSATLILDPATVTVLVREAKTTRKSPASLAVTALREALQDMADARDAKRVLARIKSGREKTVDSAEVYRRNGL